MRLKNSKVHNGKHFIKKSTSYNETTLHDMNKAGIGKNFESYGSWEI